MTQQLVAELNEMVDELEFKEVKNRRGKLVKRIVPTGKQISRMRKMIRALVTVAESGDVSAIKEVFDRVEGKAAQGIVVAEAGSPEADRMLQMPENFRDLPMTELVRLHQDMVAGRVKPNDNEPAEAPERKTA